MKQMIYNLLCKVRSNYILHGVALRIFYSRSLNNNYVYKKIYKKRIDKVISKKESSLPHSIAIGTTNACNADCIMCPHKKISKIGFMDMDLYKKIIDDAVTSGMKFVNLSFFGEPFLDKKIFERIEYAKKRELWVSLFTNGSLIHGKVRKILDSGLDSITISLDSDNKANYEKIRNKLNFDVVTRNINELIASKVNIGKTKPIIRLAFVLMEDNSSELKSYFKKWKHKVHSINIINMRNWFNSSGVAFDRKSFYMDPCALLWNDFVIDWDGEVVLCCNDWNHQEVIGNMNYQSIIDVWRGRPLNEIRSYHKNGDFDKVHICSKCDKITNWWLVN